MSIKIYQQAQQTRLKFGDARSKEKSHFKSLRIFATQ